MWRSWLYSLNRFGLREGCRTFLRVLAQTADNLQRNYFVCGNLSLLIWHFRIFQWRLCTPYRLAPRVAARLVSSLVLPWLLCEHELAWTNSIMRLWIFLQVMLLTLERQLYPAYTLSTPHSLRKWKNSTLFSRWRRYSCYCYAGCGHRSGARELGVGGDVSGLLGGPSAPAPAGWQSTDGHRWRSVMDW